MRITANVPDNLGRVIKTVASNEHKSVSSVITEAIQNYISLKKRKTSGLKVLNLIGQAQISADIHKEINSMRMENKVIMKCPKKSDNRDDDSSSDK